MSTQPDVRAFNGVIMIVRVNKLQSCYQNLMVGNYLSGAYWLGFPQGSEFGGPTAGVRLVAFNERWFAMENYEDGMIKYLSVDENDNGFLKASSIQVGDHELFEFVIEPGMEGMNRFYLRSKLGNYLVVKPVYDAGLGTEYKVAMANDRYSRDEMSIVGCFSGEGGFYRF